MLTLLHQLGAIMFMHHIRMVTTTAFILFFCDETHTEAGGHTELAAGARIFILVIWLLLYVNEMICEV